METTQKYPTLTGKIKAYLVDEAPTTTKTGGSVYAAYLNMEDGTNLMVGVKEPDYFDKSAKEVTYTLQGRTSKNGEVEYAVAKLHLTEPKPQEPVWKQLGYATEKDALICKQVALKEASNLCCNDKIELKNLLAKATELYVWLGDNSVGKVVK